MNRFQFFAFTFNLRHYSKEGVLRGMDPANSQRLIVRLAVGRCRLTVPQYRVDNAYGFSA